VAEDGVDFGAEGVAVGVQNQTGLDGERRAAAFDAVDNDAGVMAAS
jgi:hypothetical protein